MTDIPAPEQILVGLRAAIADTLDGVDLARIALDAVDTATPTLSLPVDSLALMRIVSGVEDRFRVFIPEDKAYAFTTIGELVSFVQEKTAAKAARQQGPA